MAEAGWGDPGKGGRRDERGAGGRGEEGEGSLHFLKERGLKSQRVLNHDPASPPM